MAKNGVSDFSEAVSILQELARVFLPPSGLETKVDSANFLNHEARYRTLVEQIPAVVFMAFLDRGISEAYVSPQIEPILGFSQQEWLNDPVRWYYQIHPDDRQRWNTEAAEMLLTGNPLRSTYRVMARNGKVVWFQCEAKMVRDDAGKPWFIHGVAFDLTELKETEQELQRTLDELELRVQERTAELTRANHEMELEVAERKRVEEERRQLFIREQDARKEAEEANRAKDDFLATVSHELRNPMNTMLGWIRILRTSGIDEATTARALDAIERSGSAQAKLIEDLLDVSSMVAGKLRLDLQPVDLPQIIESAVNSMLPVAEARRVAVVKEIDRTVVPVIGDADRLQQVVWNLLSNAIKFTPPGGKITVRLSHTVNQAEILVIDTGEGISPDFLPHVFGRFRQADSSIARKHGGLGLGLAITKHLVNMHGGDVCVESKGHGQGASFSVTLPFSPYDFKRLGGPSTMLSELVSTLEDVRVLVVDDDRETLEMLHSLLSRSGAEVQAAPSAATALEIMRDWQPDVIVSDIGMPKEDGYSFLRKVRALPVEEGGRIPAVALTAHTRAEDASEAIAAGFQMHLAKPIDPDELITVLNGLAKSKTSK